MRELLIGCGHSRLKQMTVNGSHVFHDVTTVDQFESHKPDIVHNLESFPYPFEDGEFDEIHAYEVLEHVGRQGDWRFFFAQWSEFHRILKEEGLFFGTVPHPSSPWAFGDPSHTRVMPIEQLAFLAQSFYTQVGATSASDFREVWKGNFEIAEAGVKDGNQFFVLRKV